MKEIMWTILEDYEDMTGERAYEVERAIDHPSEDQDILDLLDRLGY